MDDALCVVNTQDVGEREL